MANIKTSKKLLAIHFKSNSFASFENKNFAFDLFIN